jgi:three-Cys-motif partner protein
MTPRTFGSSHTKLKLEIIGAYLPAYTRALSKSIFKTHYIDAFAGTGHCDITVDGKTLTVPGSAFRAMECNPPFHRLIFIEKSKKWAAALDAMKKAQPTRDIDVIRGDANRALPACIAELSAHNDRAIVFLDPFGMQVEWGTLERVARSKLADVWYLFPLSGLYRQATRLEAKVSPDKAAALTRTFGPHDWRAEFYPEKFDLLGRAPGSRTLSAAELASCVKRWLESIFVKVSEPKLLYRKSAVGARIPIFALFFAVSNPSQRAIEIAFRIADAVLKKDWETGPT